MKFEFCYTFCYEEVGEWMVGWVDKIYLHPVIKKVHHVTECNKVVYIKAYLNVGHVFICICIVYLLINKVYKYKLSNKIVTY